MGLLMEAAFEKKQPYYYGIIQEKSINKNYLIFYTLYRL